MHKSWSWASRIREKEIIKTHTSVGIYDKIECMYISGIVIMTNIENIENRF